MQNKPDTKWYYCIGQERFGPFSEADFVREILDDKIQDETLIWYHGAAGWIKLSDLPIAAMITTIRSRVSPPPISSSKEDRENIKASDEINEPIISNYWKKKFDSVEKMPRDGAGKPTINREGKWNSNIKNFSVASFWGFMFGPLYYIKLKMYHKAAFIISIWIIIQSIQQFIESISGVPLTGKFEYFLLIVIPMYCCFYVNIDYYRFIKYKENLWDWFPKILTPTQSVASVFLVSIILAIAVFQNFDSADDILNDVSGVWRGDDGTIASIDLISKKTISIGNSTVYCSLKNSDTVSGVAVLVCNHGKNSENILVTISKRQVKSGFTIAISINDSGEVQYSYVRPL